MHVTSFPAGTPVLTPNGSVAIEDLKPGDVVLSRDQHDINGDVAPQVIEKTFVRQGELWNLQINGQSIRVTADHPLFVEGKGWIPAGEVTKGDRLATIHQLVAAHAREIWNENSSDAAVEPDSWQCDWQEVEACDSTGEVTTVYNFRVANWHTYFVGSWGFGIWVHNADYDLTGFRSIHILNRHRAGTGISGKTEFPAGWSDQTILEHVSDVATDPFAISGLGKWNSLYQIGIRDGLEIRVDFYPNTHPQYSGQISTAYPINVAPNP